MDDDFPNIAAAVLVDVEIPFSWLRRAVATCCFVVPGCNFKRPVRMEEAFRVLEALLGVGLSVLSCGKSRIEQHPRASERYGSLSG
jgi:hypothetical protein